MSVVYHWNRNVFILMTFSSLAALEVVILTTYSAASDENFVKMTTFSFQWLWENNRIDPIPMGIDVSGAFSEWTRLYYFLRVCIEGKWDGKILAAYALILIKSRASTSPLSSGVGFLPDQSM